MESWTIKEAEHQRIDAFELCWRRLLKVPWTARRSNQSILKEMSPKCSLEGLMLKLQYFGDLMPKVDSLEKTLMLEKIEGKRRRVQQRMRWLDSITDSMGMSGVNSRRKWRTEEPGMLQSMMSRRVEHNLTTEQQQSFMDNFLRTVKLLTYAFYVSIQLYFLSQTILFLSK